MISAVRCNSRANCKCHNRVGVGIDKQPVEGTNVLSPYTAGAAGTLHLARYRRGLGALDRRLGSVRTGCV